MVSIDHWGDNLQLKILLDILKKKRCNSKDAIFYVLACFSMREYGIKPTLIDVHQTICMYEQYYYERYIK